MNCIRIISLGILLLAAESMNAQNRRSWQVYAGVGFFTRNDQVFDQSNFLVSGRTNITFGDISTFGSWNTGIKYAFLDKWLTGPVFTYQSASQQLTIGTSPVGEASTRYFTFAIESTYHYYNKNNLQLYSGAGLGITWQEDSFDGSLMLREANDTYFNFQLIAGGIRWGKTLGLYAEAGYGYRGIISAGVNVSF